LFDIEQPGSDQEPVQPTFFAEDEGIGTICATSLVVLRGERLGWGRDMGVEFAKISK
jgi:hypothetical protein